MKYVAIGVAALVSVLVIAVSVLAGIAKRQTKKAQEAMRVAQIERENAEYQKSKTAILHGVMNETNKKKSDMHGAGSGSDKFSAASDIMRDNKS